MRLTKLSVEEGQEGKCGWVRKGVGGVKKAEVKQSGESELSSCATGTDPRRAAKSNRK